MLGNIFGVDLGIVLLVVVVALVFGSQLPKIARNLAMTGREFKRAHQESEHEGNDQPVAADPRASAAEPPEPKITLSRPELDALLNAREQEVRRQAGRE